MIDPKPFKLVKVKGKKKFTISHPKTPIQFYHYSSKIEAEDDFDKFMEQEAFLDGVDAFRAGKSMDDNVYPFLSMPFMSWAMGWEHEARKLPSFKKLKKK